MMVDRTKRIRIETVKKKAPTRCRAGAFSRTAGRLIAAFLESLVSVQLERGFTGIAIAAGQRKLEEGTGMRHGHWFGGGTGEKRSKSGSFFREDRDSTTARDVPLRSIGFASTFIDLTGVAL